MTAPVTVSAPGKLYLFGEYAVLAGGWSLVVAVDRRVRATRHEEAGAYRVRGADFDDTALVRAVLETLGDRASAGEPGRLETDVSAFYRDGRKLGLGSSAASAVALTAAACLDGAGASDEIPVAERDEIFTAAEAAHRAFQGGRGSGGGLAAATYGGLLGYRVREPLEPFKQLPLVDRRADRRTVGPAYVEPVECPDDLELRAAWLGEPADTTDFIDRIIRSLERDPHPVYSVLQRIGDAAEAALDLRTGAAGGPGGSAERFVDLFREGDRAMERLGDVSGAPIVIDRHRRLREVAESHGAAAKPSGAGGGDYSIVAGPAGTDWAALEAELPAGTVLTSFQFGAPGLQLESS